MFEDILVVTDRNDLAEEPVRHLEPRGRRFLDRFRAIAVNLLFPTGPTTFEPEVTDDAVEIQTDNATNHAIEIARGHGAQLHVLFVVDGVRYDTSLDSATEPLIEEGEVAVDEMVDEAERSQLSALGTVKVGRPIKLVLEYVGNHDVDLIVMNGRGTGSVRSRFRRNLVDQLTRKGPVPVHVVPWGDRGRPD